ncbi:MAG: hypothetical protein ACOH2A_08955 [Sphingobacteriaceae bacterium]
MMKQKILLIGSGSMAIAYAKVFQNMDLKFTTIGRGKNSAESFENETGLKPILGGIDSYLKNNALTINTFVVVATNTESLMGCLLQLLDAGAENILIEKPGAISIDELLLNEEKIQLPGKKVFIAYNRRFYSSVLEVEKMIEQDNGLESILFEFTEWSHVIEPLKKAPGIKENWFFANSTHVIDLAFYLAGKPAKMSSYSKSGSLSWHKKTNFSGAGITEKSVLFSYLSNWESAGRWGIELLTNKRRIYLKPLESISVQLKGSVKINDYPFDDSLDKLFKPGIYRQVDAFLKRDYDKLLDVKDHIINTKLIYKCMLS